MAKIAGAQVAGNSNLKLGDTPRTPVNGVGQVSLAQNLSSCLVTFWLFLAKNLLLFPSLTTECLPVSSESPPRGPAAILAYVAVNDPLFLS